MKHLVGQWLRLVRMLQMAFDPTKINLNVPNYNADKIIGIFTGSLSVPATSSGDTVAYAESMHTTGFGESVFTQGIYSIDGGTTWNDDNTTIPYLGGAAPSFQTLDVSSFSRTNEVGIATNNWYNFVAGAGTAYTILYKIFCIAKSNQGDITPQLTDYPLNYSSSDNYLKIRLDDIYETTITGVTSTYIIPHTIGYEPTVRAYVEHSNGEIWPASLHQFLGTAFAGDPHNPILTRIQSTDATTSLVAISDGLSRDITFHTRIYLDS